MNTVFEEGNPNFPRFRSITHTRAYSYSIVLIICNERLELVRL